MQFTARHNDRDGAFNIIRRAQAGAVSQVEAAKQLDALQIRGEFWANDAGEYVGYDYRYQRWIVC